MQNDGWNDTDVSHETMRNYKKPTDTLCTWQDNERSQGSERWYDTLHFTGQLEWWKIGGAYRACGMLTNAWCTGASYISQSDAYKYNINLTNVLAKSPSKWPCSAASNNPSICLLCWYGWSLIVLKHVIENYYYSWYYCSSCMYSAK